MQLNFQQSYTVILAKQTRKDVGVILLFSGLWLHLLLAALAGAWPVVHLLPLRLLAGPWPSLLVQSAFESLAGPRPLAGPWPLVVQSAFEPLASPLLWAPSFFFFFWSLFLAKKTKMWQDAAKQNECNILEVLHHLPEDTMGGGDRGCPGHLTLGLYCTLLSNNFSLPGVKYYIRSVQF